MAYQSTPEIYEHDLREIIDFIDALRMIQEERETGIFVYDGSLTLWSKNDYPMGTVYMDGDQWVFRPHNESDTGDDF